MKPEEEVKLVGKPLMFKPLSVARKPTKKKTTNGVGGGAAKAMPQAASPIPRPVPANTETKAPEPKKKKMSLFSLGAEDEPEEDASTKKSGAYEPVFTLATAEDDSGAGEAAYSADAYSQAGHSTPSYGQHQQSQSLTSVADDLNLSAAERRELFGRGGPSSTATASKLVNFNMAQEYDHNEAVRAAGETAVHNPVRSIAAGKHSLRQIVNAVQTNRSALEESFAAAKGNRKDAAGRYGWR
jgi:hypothetical protein